MTEMIDLYDENRKPTGLTVPRNTKLQKNEFMLYVLALIENKEKKYLVTRRALDKKWAAGAWEIPGGGVSAGETSKDALYREVLEETGINLRKCSPRVIYSYKNEDTESGDNYFVDIYLCPVDFQLKDIRIQESEVLDVTLVSIEDIHRLHECDGFLHYERICTALDAVRK